MATNSLRVPSKSINITSGETPTENGDITVNSNKLEFHNGTTTSPVVTESHTATLANKSLSDTTTAVVDVSDATKKIIFDAGGTTNTSTTITAAQTANRVLTLPDATDTVVARATTDTLTNKVLSGNTASNLISGSGTLTLNTTGTVTLPNATDTLVGKATTDTLTNKTLNGNTATNLVSGSGTFTLNTTGTITSPNATDTLVGKATTDTLTNKSISGSTNTITNVSLTTGVTGTLPIGNGGTGQTTANPAFNALSPLTTKGDLVSYSTVNARLPVGSDGFVLTADSAQTLGVSWAAAAAAPTYVKETYNLGLSVAVAANAVTIALKQADGSTNPSTGSAAVKIGFRSSTATSGAHVERSVTAALSTVISSGSTGGTTSGVQSTVYLYAIDNAGTVELAWSSIVFDEESLQSTTAEGGAGAADSINVLYSTTARSNVAIRLIGKFISTQATAGTWASSPTLVSIIDFDPNADVYVKATWDGTNGFTISSSFTKIPFSTILADSHGGFTTGTSASYTIKVAGDYYFSMNSISGNKTVEFFVTSFLFKGAAQGPDGTGCTKIKSLTTNNYRLNSDFTGIYEGLAVGDVITLQVKEGATTSGGTYDGGGHFVMFRMNRGI